MYLKLGFHSSFLAVATETKSVITFRVSPRELVATTAEIAHWLQIESTNYKPV